VKAKSRSDSTCSAATLFQVCLRAPDCGIVCHVVMRSEQLHLCSTARNAHTYTHTDWQSRHTLLLLYQSAYWPSVWHSSIASTYTLITIINNNPQQQTLQSLSLTHISSTDKHNTQTTYTCPYFWLTVCYSQKYQQKLTSLPLLQLLFFGELFWRYSTLRQVNLWECCIKFLLLPNQQCQSTEGQLTVLMNVM